MGSIQIQNDVYIWRQRQRQNQMRKKQQHQGIKLSCGKNNKNNNKKKKNISYCDIVRSEIQTKQTILNHKLSCLHIKRPFKNTINP